MSPSAPPAAPGACVACRRRSWLLAELTGPLEFVARDRTRLQALLALGDDELIAALGGRRRAQLTARHAGFDAGECRPNPCVETFCRHDPRYPTALRDAGGPRMLHVLGGASRLAELAATPIVLIAGDGRPSDYGIEIAASLGRGLGSAGITVICAVAGPIALAAQAAALEAGGRTIAVTGSGLGVPAPARARALLTRAARRGCTVSELPCGHAGRVWGTAASERILARLSRLTVMVEAGEHARGLAQATVARELGRTVAAVPGRVTSPLSAGTNALLMDGARLVRCAQDVVELLYPLSAPATPADEARSLRARVPPRLLRTLALVGGGCDTPEKLVARGVDLDDALLALSELELMALLVRGDGGRYLPRSGAGY